MAHPDTEISKIPVNVTDEFCLTMQSHFAKMYDVTDSRGVVDFNRLKTLVAYNMGDNINAINTLLLQEKFKLADFELYYSATLAEVVDETKKGSRARGYEVNASEGKYLIEGNNRVIECKRNVLKQTAFVQYIEKQLDTVKYYTNGAKLLLDAERMKYEYGTR